MNTLHSEVVATLSVDNSSSWKDALADELVETLEETITSLPEKLAPNRFKSFHVHPSNVWLDDDCRALKRIARLRERNYNNSKLPTVTAA